MVLDQLEIVDPETVSVVEQVERETNRAGFEYVSFEEEDRLVAEGLKGLLQPHYPPAIQISS